MFLCEFFFSIKGSKKAGWSLLYKHHYRGNGGLVDRAPEPGTRSAGSCFKHFHFHLTSEDLVSNLDLFLYCQYGGVWWSLFSSKIFWAGKKGITNPDRFCLSKNELTKTVIRDMRKLIPGFFQNLEQFSLFKFRATRRHFANCFVRSTQKNPSLLATNMNTKDWHPDQRLIYKCHLQNSGIRQALSSQLQPGKQQTCRQLTDSISTMCCFSLNHREALAAGREMETKQTGITFGTKPKL